MRRGGELRCQEHPEELARNCRWCRADQLGGIPNPFRDAPAPDPQPRRPMPRVPDPEEKTA